MFSEWLTALDGAAFDMCTVGGAVFGLLVRPFRRAVKGSEVWFTRVDCGKDFLNGAAAAPFVFLFGSAFSKTLLDITLHAGPATLALAGGVGLIFVVGELTHGD